MDVATLAEQIIADPAALERLVALLPTEAVTALCEHFKGEADRHWWINANRSLEFAELIVRSGRVCNDTRLVALGTMARGDALKLVGKLQAAWNELGQAGDLFLQVGDEVGWARTRIGRLVLCVDLNTVATALSDAAQARAIFEQQNIADKWIVLQINSAIVYNQLGEQRQALDIYHAALQRVNELGSSGDGHKALLLNCMGNAYNQLGDFRQALVCYEQACMLFKQRNETSGEAVAELNIAHIAAAQGNYRRALQLLQRVSTLFSAEQLVLDAADARKDTIECYLLLNRYAEARDLARQVIEEYQTINALYAKGLTLLHLATAEAALSNWQAAEAALDAANPILEAVHAHTWLATVHLRRGKIALQQGNVAQALHEASIAIVAFAGDQQVLNYAQAALLHGQASLAMSDSDAAVQAGATALRVAQQHNVPLLRYNAHLLLGNVAEQQGNVAQAARRYGAAVATIERVQRDLTVTLRPGFLEDKNEALRALIRLQLQQGHTIQAFEALERAKSQALLGYLHNRESLHWASDNPANKPLIEALYRLREEHHWFYRLAHERMVHPDERPSAVTPQQARIELARREHRMRAISEQLYLNVPPGEATRVTPPRLIEVQAHLAENSLLIEFFNDGAALWAFTLKHETLDVCQLAATPAEIDLLIAQLQSNFGFALGTGTSAAATKRLAALAQRILQKLYQLLVEPIVAHTQGCHRLVIAPYGALHYLPWHLLHNAAGYLIEQYEVVVTPAAGLLTRRAPVRATGTLALAHSWQGRLPHTHAEAQLVQQLFGGVAHYDNAARRTVLEAQPTQILHIAAHGEHRLDQPDLSYILLADGQLYTDDLLQEDLSYELVTLSACETGRARVSGGDELIGLGRGFLYAGAGALLASMWRVEDAVTLALMEYFYRSLRTGASKAAALRAAQLVVLQHTPELHPAFWGAFQLVGNAEPLSSVQC